ncbi:MAG: hypothetical protein H5T65_10540 [Chloroflexi bacterium]|nr:hypothetical protein [Chloroflexota bacterium]
MEKRRFFAILAALVILVAMLPMAAFADEDQTTGQFTTANAAPSVGDLGIYETDHTTQVTAMTPGTEYAVKVTVTDANTLNDLATVKVTIFFDADGDDDPGDVPGTGDTQTAAILTWTKGTPSTWTISAGSPTTWAIVTANCVEPSLTGSTGTWWFHFRPGKVATEATDWDAYVVATDDNSATGTLYDGSNYDMNWYGEVTVNTALVDWGTLAPGTDYTIQAGIQVNYLANGGYNQQVKASGSWDGASHTATLNTAGTPAANEFSLMADDDNTIADAVQVLSAAYATFNTGTQTGESGHDETGNSLWLKLGSPFFEDTYSGYVYFQIIND